MTEVVPGYQFAYRVLQNFGHPDSQPGLMWWLQPDGSIKFYADCSDTFYWGTADAEEITPENLYVLEVSYQELKALGAVDDLAVLFAARVRNLRPQGAAYKLYSPQVQALFDAVGPERGIDYTNPKDQDGVYKYQSPDRE